MEQSPVTIVINGSTYTLNANDADAIQQIPRAERQKLITLLEAIQQHDRTAISSEQPISTDLEEVWEDSIKHATQAPTLDQQDNSAQAAGGGDIDALMARLIMEERANQKEVPTRQSLYKIIGGVTIVIIVLILVF